MKLKLLLILLSLILVLIMSCANQEESSLLTEAPEETTNEVEIVIPAYETEEELLELIMANKSVWEQEYIISGTLVDLDYDGVPEFLVSYSIYTPEKSASHNLKIFKIDGDTLKEIKTIEHIYTNDSYHTEVKVIIPYTDDNGVKGWIIPYRISGDEYNQYWEYFLSVFTFSGDNVTETVKFYAKIANVDFSREGYYGYEYLNTEYYIDGVECKAPQDEIDEFMIELDRLINESDEAQARGERGGFPWECGSVYMNPSQTIWEAQKVEFLNNLLSIESAYNLFPYIDSEYITYSSENSWYYEENIEPALRKVIESYFGDGEYLRTTDLYYDNDGAMCKPVIYLYPAETTNVSVTVAFNDDGYFTCTYPDYGDGWNVTASPDGTLTNQADGLEYSYLYWEAESNVTWDLSSGFVVKGSDTAAFLQETLAYLGLTPREYNEFIVYWLPLMQNNNYNLITFQTTVYEDSVTLNVSPEPDSILRVFMAYVPLEEAIDIPEQQLKQFERTGFTVIEWGGTCVE